MRGFEDGVNRRGGRERRRGTINIHPIFLHPIYSGLRSLSLLSSRSRSSRLPSLDAGRKLSTPGSFGLGLGAWGLGVPGWEAEPFCCPLAGAEAPLVEAEVGLGEPLAGGGAEPGGG
jgi:hypothetical protein